MICVKCNSNNTKCIDDMLQINYIAEIYTCLDCGGVIEVQYKSSNICSDQIKNYKYTTKEDIPNVDTTGRLRHKMAMSHAGIGSYISNEPLVPRMSGSEMIYRNAAIINQGINMTDASESLSKALNDKIGRESSYSNKGSGRRGYGPNR